MYLFYQGRFMEGLYIYPLMITIYVIMHLSRKRKEWSKKGDASSSRDTLLNF